MFRQPLSLASPLRAVLAAFAALALVLSACGDEDADVVDVAPEASPEGGTDGADGADGVQVDGDMASKPTIRIPDGDPPTTLQTQDLVAGDGAQAGPGSTVTAHYVGVSWSTGAEFDSSWDGEAAVFPLDRVIAGWSEGLQGMREGGRRLLVIPPEMGYGDAPPPGSEIEPGETLVFVVDLVAVD